MDAANEAFLDGFREHTMEGVREYAEGYPVELRRDVRTGRWMVTAFAECQNRVTQVDLFDLCDWLDKNIATALAAAEARGAAQQAQEPRKVVYTCGCEYYGHLASASCPGHPSHTEAPSPDFARGRAAGLREAAEVCSRLYNATGSELYDELRALATEAETP